MKNITVSNLINKSIDIVWDSYTNTKHVVNWNFASDTWYCPKAENNFYIGGYFIYRMSAKDNIEFFDFKGIYDEIEVNRKICYHLEDDRKVIVAFELINDNTKVDITFDLETENSAELQRFGWQSILDNFKKYTESII